MFLKTSTNVNVFNYFYDKGLREGDIIPILTGRIEEYNQVKTDDPASWKKISQFLAGTIVFSQSTFVGEIGAKFVVDYTKTFTFVPQYLACLEYDGMLLLSHSLDLAVSRGFDFEESDVL